MKEGIVQYLEKILAEKLFGKKGTKKRSHQQQLKNFSSKQSLNGTSALLLKDFFNKFNDDVYKKSLQSTEAIVLKYGEKVFQKRLCAMVKASVHTYIDDQSVSNWLCNDDNVSQTSEMENKSE